MSSVYVLMMVLVRVSVVHDSRVMVVFCLVMLLVVMLVGWGSFVWM